MQFGCGRVTLTKGVANSWQYDAASKYLTNIEQINTGVLSNKAKRDVSHMTEMAQVLRVMT